MTVDTATTAVPSCRELPMVRRFSGCASVCQMRESAEPSPLPAVSASTMISGQSTRTARSRKSGRKRRKNDVFLMKDYFLSILTILVAMSVECSIIQSQFTSS